MKTEIPVQYKLFFENVIKLRGKISTVVYEKSLNPQKRAVKKYGEFGNIVKRSTFQVRAGIDYENIKVVKEKHESGEVVRRGLPDSMERVDTGIYHNIITDTWIVGCAPVKNQNSIRITEYYIDNEKIELDTIISEDVSLRDILYAKDIKSSESDWLNLTVTNIKSLSGV